MIRMRNGVRVDDAFGNWFAGLVAGEGHFAITHHKGCDIYHLRFCLKLRDDDAAVLLMVRRTLRVGHVYRIAQSGRSKPQIMFAVDDKAQLLSLVDLFDAYPLRAKKSRDYAIWRAAVLHVNTLPPGGIRGPRRGAVRWNGWPKLARMKERLHSVRAYRGGAS